MHAYPGSVPSSSFWATARQPKWISLLVLALLLATAFVVLSAWQFDQSRTEQAAPQDTETPVEFTGLYEPARPISVTEADRIVEVTGEFVPDTQRLVDSRLRDGEEGYWAVAAFRVDGAPNDEVVPVVLGWTEDAQWLADVEESGLDLDGDAWIEGRLLPTEAPGSGPRDLSAGVLPTLSVAELINIWDEDSYSGFVVAFEMELADQTPLSHEELGLESVWVGTQPEEDEINWLNLFYAVEWVVFAGFAFYFWWRMVKDAAERQAEEERLDREWEEQWRAEQQAKQRQDLSEEHS